MKAPVAVFALSLLLAACQGGFTVDGTVTSSTGRPLNDCKLALRHEDNSEVRPQMPFVAPTLAGRFAVAPFYGWYLLTVSCTGHAPYTHRIHYGTDTLPTKDLHLGHIELVADNGA